MSLFRNRYRIESARLPYWDYSSPGWYFFTVCTHDRKEIFGSIINSKMNNNDYGRIVWECWQDLPNHYSNMCLDEFVVMPNHIHGVIRIVDIDPVFGSGNYNVSDVSNVSNVETGFKPVSTTGTGTAINNPTIQKFHGLSEFVRALKTFSSRKINCLRQKKGVPIWQTRFHDHIIRSEKSLYFIRRYIRNNPAQWGKDRFAS